MKWDIEYSYIAHSSYPAEAIAGVDEAGRGPLAGDVFAGAVILPFGIDIPFLRDSKKLSRLQRERVYELIVKHSLSFCVARATLDEIEELNILGASQLAMRRAVAGLTLPVSLTLVDGNIAWGFPTETRTIVRGDNHSPSIAAASVLAKVERDRYMMTLDKLYPQYGFSHNNGYPTRFHREMIAEYGLSPVHRRGFKCL